MKVGFLTIRNCLLSCHSVYISSSFFFFAPRVYKKFFGTASLLCCHLKQIQYSLSILPEQHGQHLWTFCLFCIKLKSPLHQQLPGNNSNSGTFIAPLPSATLLQSSLGQFRGSCAEGRQEVSRAAVHRFHISDFRFLLLYNKTGLICLASFPPSCCCILTSLYGKLNSGLSHGLSVSGFLLIDCYLSFLASTATRQDAKIKIMLSSFFDFWLLLLQQYNFLSRR